MQIFAGEYTPTEPEEITSIDCQGNDAKENMELKNDIEYLKKRMKRVKDEITRLVLIITKRSSNF